MQHLVVLLVAERHQFGIGDQVEAVPVGDRHLGAGDDPEQDPEDDPGNYLEPMQEPLYFGTFPSAFRCRLKTLDVKRATRSDDKRLATVPQDLRFFPQSLKAAFDREEHPEQSNLCAFGHPCHVSRTANMKQIKGCPENITDRDLETENITRRGKIQIDRMVSPYEITRR